MKTKILEVTNGPRNWGKFLIGRFDEEWARESMVAVNNMVLPAVGWTREHILVVDLQTGEGGIFRHGGMPHHDLNKKRIWVCPMFEPMLGWLFSRPLADFDTLPALVDLKDAEFAWSGYRREGPRLPAVPQEAKVESRCSKCGGPAWAADDKAVICIDCLINAVEGAFRR